MMMIPLAGATTLVLWLSSSNLSSSSASSSCSFLPPAPSVSTIRRGRHGRLLATSSAETNDDDGARNNIISRRGKLIAAARRTAANNRRMPRHQEEAAGISTSLGLWRRSAATETIRRYAKEIYDTMRNERRGKRRRKLKTRFVNYLSLDDGRRSNDDNDNVNDIDGYDNIRPEVGNNENEDDSDIDNTNLHAMRARAGVLRTRIRLRQESLMHITRLVRDVKLELRMMEFKYTFDDDDYNNPTTTSTSTSKKERTSTIDNSGQQQQQQQQQRRRDDTNTVMNEYELTNINQKWRNQFTVSSDRARSDYESYMRNRRDYDDEIANDDDVEDGMSVHNNNNNNNNKLLNKFQLNRMVQRSNQLQSSILLDQIRLQRLERRIVCYENDGDEGIFERIVGNTLYAMNEFPSLGYFASAYYYSNDNSPNSNNSNDTGDTIMNPITIIKQRIKKFSITFNESTLVLLRKLDRVSSVSTTTTTTSAAAATTTIQGEGVNIINNSRNYTSLTDYIIQETSAGIRIIGNLLSNPGQLTHLVDPETPTLVAHVPAILTRLDRLETHVTPILNRVLNNKQHLRSIEPYLGVILERLDDIEPHLPWILDHIDTLAPYTGLLLKHIDELLLYAKVDKYEEQSVIVLAEAGGGNSTNDDSGSIRGGNYAFADQLLPYLEVYVSQLDLVGPHLPLLRPHLPLLLKHNRIKILSPHVGRLFSRGYTDLSASANMDILLFYFGWALHIPFIPRLFFSFPGSPRMVSFLANKLPKRLVRGQCCDISCYVDGDYGKGWNELSM